MFAWLLLLSQVAASANTRPVDPPPVNEAALAARLVEMTRPKPGERAIIVYDPTYYPAITNLVREELHRRGVFTYLLVEESPSMIASYMDDDPRHERQEEEVVGTLRPLFQRADIFYWMPARGYGDDLRWERLVEESKVRSVHFHWLLPFPGSRSAEEIVAASRRRERECLEVDLAAHADRQRRLANAIRGRTLRITTPAGTALRVVVPRDQWFHRSDGDASRERATHARSIRDREIELPVGLFNFVPESATVNGVVVAERIAQDVEARGITASLQKGRVTNLEARAGLDAVRRLMASSGPDGGRIAAIWMNTNPHTDTTGTTIEIGSNWENGGRNDAIRARRIGFRLTNATIAADDLVIMRDGRILWDALP